MKKCIICGKSASLQPDEKISFPQCYRCNNARIKVNKKLYGPFLWMGFNCLKPIEPIQGDSLLFATKFPEVSGTYLIDPGRMKE